MGHLGGQPPTRPGHVLDPGTRVHILYGHGDGSGGHRSGAGVPAKTEFPKDWTDEDIVRLVKDVGRNPGSPPRQRTNGTWQCKGVREDVEITVYLRTDGSVATAYPRRGDPGVVKNPPEGREAHGRA
ncbi:EndoU domain-containing protein [Phytomonospora sp. NPDC050363]|uniref:EndoU domain-containing protein n=1 Tax=Phytomonospora sp. NPDC050363 TaxID=3155642 RepID=UPI00340746D1